MKDFGTYENPDGGMKVAAGSANEAVYFEFHGWKKVDEKPTVPAASSAGGKTS